MLCLRCWHWWPSDSRYCGVCQLSLNARRCGDGHPNPLWGPHLTCCTCNKPLLCQGVPALPMRWLPKGGAILGLVWLGYHAVRHADVLLDAVWRGAVWLLVGTLHAIPTGVWQGIVNLISVWIALYLFSIFLPKDLGGPVRQFLIGSVRTAVRLVANLFRILATSAFALVKACVRSRERVPMKARRDRGKARERNETTDGHS